MTHRFIFILKTMPLSFPLAQTRTPCLNCEDKTVAWSLRQLFEETAARMKRFRGKKETPGIWFEDAQTLSN